MSTTAKRRKQRLNKRRRRLQESSLTINKKTNLPVAPSQKKTKVDRRQEEREAFKCSGEDSKYYSTDWAPVCSAIFTATNNQNIKLTDRRRVYKQVSAVKVRSPYVEPPASNNRHDDHVSNNIHRQISLGCYFLPIYICDSITGQNEGCVCVSETTDSCLWQDLNINGALLAEQRHWSQVDAPQWHGLRADRSLCKETLIFVRLLAFFMSTSHTWRWPLAGWSEFKQQQDGGYLLKRWEIRRAVSESVHWVEAVSMYPRTATYITVIFTTVL